MNRLCETIPGQRVLIQALTNTGGIRRRLLDIGFFQGAIATCLYKSPAGDPTAYEILGTTVALRKKDSADILITPLED